MALRFGRSVGGNWNGANTWSTTSGGTNDVPGGLAAGDDVVLDSNSAGTFTINTAISLASIDCSGLTTGASGAAFAGTLTRSAGITQTISGDDSTVAAGSKPLRLVNGMTYNQTNNNASFIFSAASGTVTIDVANKLTGDFTTGSTGTSTATFSLTNDLNSFDTNSVLLHTSGTFPQAGHARNITYGQFQSSNSNTRTVNMGSGQWRMNITRNANGWTYTTTTNLTHNKDTATLLFGASLIGGIGFQHGGKPFYNVVFTDNGAGFGKYVIQSLSTTLDFMTISKGTAVRFGVSSGQTLTINNAFTWGTGGSISAGCLFMPETIDLNRPIISVASGACTIDFGMIQGFAFQGGATFDATNSVGCGNTGLTFAPSGVAHSYGLSGGMP